MGLCIAFTKGSLFSLQTEWSTQGQKLSWETAQTLTHHDMETPPCHLQVISVVPCICVLCTALGVLLYSEMEVLFFHELSAFLGHALGQTPCTVASSIQTHSHASQQAPLAVTDTKVYHSSKAFSLVVTWLSFHDPLATTSQ